ncbi:hypothetical protein NDU88_004968 [Pleurodeles waltl]|uniref:Uncharacterized protein n=1 Tax=Pleurodeles waltl TaxID=8319 RepID=A0AAV7T9F5_PLEWA|nr:hypothetical protein NDU88_004968 [Pleurodeles waltl]
MDRKQTAPAAMFRGADKLIQPGSCPPPAPRCGAAPKRLKGWTTRPRVLLCTRMWGPHHMAIETVCWSSVARHVPGRRRAKTGLLHRLRAKQGCAAPLSL